MEKDAQTRLIEAATPLFARKGFTAVSIRELAQAANVNSALISYHFWGKEGLYHQVLEKQFEPVAQMLAKLEGMDAVPAIERLMFYANHVAAIHRESPFLTHFLNSELTTPTLCYEAVVKKYIARLFRFIRTALMDGMAAGDINPALDLDYAAVSLAGIMNFYFIVKPLFQEFTPQPKQDTDYTSQAIKIYLNGIIRRQSYV